MTLSLTLLWIIVIIQSVIMFYLVKLVVEFLNKFRAANAVVSNEQIKLPNSSDSLIPK